MWACSLAWAVSFGGSYGVGLHVSYLIHGLHLANPAFLQNDWFAAHTTDFQPVFSRLVALLSVLGVLQAATIVLNVALHVGAGLILYRIVAAVSPAEHRVTLFLLILTLSALDGTRTVALSVLFSFDFQGSTIAVVGLLAGCWLYLRGRYLAAGLALAAGGAFHANYLVLAPPVFALALLLDGNKSLVKRGALLLGPSVPVILLHLPLLLHASGGEAGNVARTILQQIRSPWHYNFATYWRSDLPVFAWVVLGGLGAAAARSTPQWRAIRPLVALFAATTSLVVLATLQAVVGPSPVLTQLYLWRFAPLAVLFAQILVCGSLLMGPRRTVGAEPAPRVTWQNALGILAFLVVIHETPFYWNDLVDIGCILVLAGALAWPWLGATRINRRALASVVFCVATACQGFGTLHLGGLLGRPPGEERELYAWAARTAERARFLVPLDLEDFRLHAGRAIVVDWKTHPFMAAELIEWYRRVGRVSGDSSFRTEAVAVGGYAAMTAERLNALVHDFEVDYVVVRKEWSWPPLPGYKVVFANAGFVVYASPVPVGSNPTP